jgi:hypothetical protein
MRDEIFIRLLVLDQKDVGASVDQVARQEQVYREHVTALHSYRRTLQPLHTEERVLNSLAADAALFHAEAHLRWLEHCAAVLKEWQTTAVKDAAVERTPRDRAARACSTARSPLTDSTQLR